MMEKKSFEKINWIQQKKKMLLKLKETNFPSETSTIAENWQKKS